jgi:NAD(P)-dependent dehydrogenase (short-subunit alcohol dehydrogenase family)
MSGVSASTRKARNATVAIVGAGDYIGSAIARKFASEGYIVFLGRRLSEKLGPLKAEIELAGGRAEVRSLDARDEDEVIAFLHDANRTAPLEVCIFNVGANVSFPLIETSSRVFRKVWEMACFAGFLTAREAARHMIAQGKGSLFFTGATAGLRGGSGYAAFASAKFGLRAIAQAAARELGPANIHVAHLIIDAGVDTAWVRERIRDRGGDQAIATLQPDRLMRPEAVAEAYWTLHQQPRDAWTFEQEIRPYAETW